MNSDDYTVRISSCRRFYNQLPSKIISEECDDSNGMMEKQLQLLSDTGSRNESTLESFRRLDVYPTAQRICSSSHHTSPEKSSPRQLRKQIFISEEKIRKSASRSPQSSDNNDKNSRSKSLLSSPAEMRSNIMEPFNAQLCRDNNDRNFRSKSFPSSPAEKGRHLTEHFNTRSESPSIASTMSEHLEILSRTPVRALRPFAGACFLTATEKLLKGSINHAQPDEKVDLMDSTVGVAPRSRSSTMTSTLSCLSSDF